MQRPTRRDTARGGEADAAVRDALIRHKQAGLPIVIWRDGAVVWVPPEEIVLQEDGASE